MNNKVDVYTTIYRQEYTIDATNPTSSAELGEYNNLLRIWGKYSPDLVKSTINMYYDVDKFSLEICIKVHNSLIDWEFLEKDGEYKPTIRVMRETHQTWKAAFI